VLIFIIFYMFVVFGVMVFKSKADLRGHASLLTAFHTLFCLFAFLLLLPFCASLPSAVCEKRALPFLMRAQRCANSLV
jgi:hypothetical protein